MKRTDSVHSWVIRVLFAVLLLLGAGSVRKALAQGCGSWMTPRYSTYINYSTDWTYIYTSVSVTGTSTGTCPVGCYCSGVTHRPDVYNKIGIVGGWNSGTAVPWNSYIDYTSNRSAEATAGVDYKFSSIAEIICSAVGTFYYLAEPDVFLRWAITNYIWTDTEGTECLYYLWCPNGNSAATCPADNPVYVDSTQNQCESYLQDYRLRVTILGSSTCFPVGKAELNNKAKNCS